MGSAPVVAAPAAPRWLTRSGAALEWVTLGAMRLGLPLSPLLMALIGWHLAHLRSYRASWRRAAAHTAELRRIGVIRRGVEQRWAPQAGGASRIEGGCTHCGRCCVNGLCVFVAFDAHGKSSCGIHGKWFFRWLTCGKYPRNQRDIEAYQCPSFTALPRAGETRRVIPLRAER